MWNRRNNNSSSSSMLINCSFCGTALTLPPGAASIICAVCNHVSRVSSGRPQNSPSAPNVHGSKKALICGVSYRNTRQELKGTVNDARCMKHLLITKFRFPESAILVLTEDQTDFLKLPTKQNIRMAMHWLVQGCRHGDTLVFHYSGHGSQRRNYSGDEVDNLDETLLPMDFKRQGVIVDDELNLALVRPLPRGVRLHAIVDACHSGTVLDLPFLCKLNSQGSYFWEDHRPRTGVWKGTSGGDAYCFSGCDDNQASADTNALSRETYTGAMTFTFIQAIERGNAKTYRELLVAMREGVQKVDIGGGPITALVQMLLTGGSGGWRPVQEPQLTSSNPFSIDSPFYV